jgi:meso-butanediol dehydrogenase / (S,S)-butanediol dehydrogenase / diacetyl reductase
MNDFIFITGSSGEIGVSICKNLLKNGFTVVGLDIKKNNIRSKNYVHLNVDLKKFVNNEIYYNKIKNSINKILENNKLKALINCAAIQKLSKFENLKLQDLKTTFDINFFSIVKIFKLVIRYMKKNHGIFINISSIHSQSTKKNFFSYSSSKAALTSFTKSMSLEFGRYISSIAIEPGAIKTKMLSAGFKNKKDLKNLKKIIPTNKIATPSDISDLVITLIEKDIRYLNGSVIDISGGIKNYLN